MYGDSWCGIVKGERVRNTKTHGHDMSCQSAIKNGQHFNVSISWFGYWWWGGVTLERQRFLDLMAATMRASLSLYADGMTILHPPTKRGNKLDQMVVRVQVTQEAPGEGSTLSRT